MLALAGYRLGFEFRFLDPASNACAGQVGELIVGDFSDEATLARFADGLDLVTLEWENVPVATACSLASRLPFFPPPQALESSQDRLIEKSLFRKLAIGTAPFAAVDSEEGLKEALREIGYPAVLKTRLLGYDGKGQHVLRTPDEIDDAWQALAGQRS